MKQLNEYIFETLNDNIKKLFRLMEIKKSIKKFPNGENLNIFSFEYKGIKCKLSHLEYVNEWNTPENLKGHHLVYCKPEGELNKYFDLDETNEKICTAIPQKDKELFVENFLKIWNENK